MTEIKIGIDNHGVYKFEIPDALADSKIAEKLVTVYLENQVKVKLEKEKTEQLKEENRRKKEEDQYRVFYMFGFVVIAIIGILSTVLEYCYIVAILLVSLFATTLSGIYLYRQWNIKSVKQTSEENNYVVNVKKIDA